MAVDYGLTVDKEGFNASMEEARQKARNARNKVMQKLIMKVILIIKTFLFFILCKQELWHCSKAGALWPWGHGFKFWKQPLVEMQGKTVNIRPKVVGPFPAPCASWSYMHRAALFD
jgi:hypothetical protein